MGSQALQNLLDFISILLAFLVSCGLFVGHIGGESLKLYDKIEFKCVTLLSKALNQLPNYKLACSPVFTVLDEFTRTGTINSNVRQNWDDTVLQTTLSLPSLALLLPVSFPLQCQVHQPERVWGTEHSV